MNMKQERSNSVMLIWDIQRHKRTCTYSVYKTLKATAAPCNKTHTTGQARIRLRYSVQNVDYIWVAKETTLPSSLSGSHAPARRIHNRFETAVTWVKRTRTFLGSVHYCLQLTERTSVWEKQTGAKVSRDLIKRSNKQQTAVKISRNLNFQGCFLSKYFQIPILR